MDIIAESLSAGKLNAKDVKVGGLDVWEWFQQKLSASVNFKGGFDEMPLLYQYILGIDASTDEGKKKMLEAHTLAIRWEAADAYCKHESEKLRWKPAEWWKFCWAQTEK